MAHIRVLQVAKDDKKGDSLKMLPGTFKNDQDATASIKESGDYLFLPVHSITVKKGKEKNGNNTIDTEEE